MLGIFIQLLILLMLATVAFQDYRYRGVSWFLFPLLVIAALIGLWQDKNLYVFMPLMMINLVFVFVLLFGLTLYFSLKNRKVVHIADVYLGWGDILFFVVLTVFFSPLNFLMFIVGSLLFVSLIVTVIPRLSQNIPLAGIQASLLIPPGLMKYTSWDPGLQSDVWIVSLLMQWS